MPSYGSKSPSLSPLSWTQGLCVYLGLSKLWNWSGCCSLNAKSRLFVIITNFEAYILYGRHRICISWFFYFSPYRNWLRMCVFSSFNPHNSKKGETGPQKYCGDCSISLLGCGFFYDVFSIVRSTFKLPLVRVFIFQIGETKTNTLPPTQVILRFLHWTEHRAIRLPRSKWTLTPASAPAVGCSGAGFFVA